MPLYVTNLRSFQTVFLEHDNEFTVLKVTKRAPLGCGGRRDFYFGCAADRSAGTV